MCIVDCGRTLRWEHWILARFVHSNASDIQVSAVRAENAKAFSASNIVGNLMPKWLGTTDSRKSHQVSQISQSYNLTAVDVLVIFTRYLEIRCSAGLEGK